jgi:anti-sigma-K factor RskA
MSSQREGGVPELSCEEVAELAGLYVLDALEPAERVAFEAHLATCSEAHEEIASLGGVVPALASMADPIDAPADLKSKVMAAYERENAQGPVRPAAVDAPRPAIATAVPPPPWRLPAWASWGAAIAAVLVIGVVGVWALGVQSRAERVSQRAQQLASAVALLSAPDSSVAFVRGAGSAVDDEGIRGFAAFPPAGAGYVVMVGLPEASAGKTYQAWYVVDGQPASAGLMTVDEDGYAVLVGAQPPAGTNLVAVTVEPAGGSERPTTDPIAAGEVRTAT